MTLEEERDFYRVWFEYLTRTPAYLRWADWMERTYSGENIPWPADLHAFSVGYDGWFKHDLPWEVSFDKVYSRITFRNRMIAKLNQHAFTPSEDIASNSSHCLENEREELGRALTFQEEKAIIEKAARETLAERTTREKEYKESFKKYHYRSKPPGLNWGSVLSATLKRRLTYYHLQEIVGLSRDEIIRADDPISQNIPILNRPANISPPPFGLVPFGPLPFGRGPFLSNPTKEIDFFRYWKRGYAKRDPRHFLSEEIAEARNVIAAVEAGWFPAPPPPFKNSTMENPS